MQRIFSHYWPYFWLTLLCLMLYLPGITTMPIVDRDSPHFAQATRQMVASDNYFQIKFQNKPRHLKPPGIYWLQAIFVKIFSYAKSTQVWPYRLSSALGGLLAVLLTFGFTRKIYGDKVAALAAALLACCVLLIIESHLIVTDACLLATMVAMQGALWQMYINYHKQAVVSNDLMGWRGNIMPLIFWLAMAAGVLIKGITPLIALLTIVTLSIADRNWRWLRCLRFQWGLPLFILLCLAWLVPLSLASSSNFLLDMIHGDVIPKLIGGQESHGAPPGYFVLLFTLLFWPGALFYWYGAYWGYKCKHLACERFLLAWFIPTWLFFAIVPTKLPEYVLPAYPAVAILIAKAIYALKNNPLPPKLFTLNRMYYIIWLLYGFGLAGLFIYIPYYVDGHFNKISLLVSLLILCVSIWAIWQVWQDRLFKTAKVLILSTLFIFAPIYQFVLPSLKPLWVSQAIAQAIQQQAPDTVNPQHPLIAIGYAEPSLVFLMGTKKVWMTSVAAAVSKLQQDQYNLVIIDSRNIAEFKHAARQAHLQSKILARIQGFDFSRGKWVKLQLLRVNSDHGLG